jgi:integrase
VKPPQKIRVRTLISCDRLPFASARLCLRYSHSVKSQARLDPGSGRTAADGASSRPLRGGAGTSRHDRENDWAIRPPKKRGVERTTFSEDQERAILAQNDRRDRLALHLLLKAGIRKGALQGVQFRHFDHAQRRLTVFTKGGKVQTVPIVDPAFWNELERHILDWGAQPNEYLLPRRTVRPNRHKPGERFVTEYRDEPMGVHGLHKWWYACLARAGVVPKGQTSGERMHKARHTAGQRVLDGTRGNLKAVQKLLGHSSISTTGDIYTDWDIDQLAETLRGLLEESER